MALNLEPINLAAYQIRMGRDSVELGDKNAASIKGWLKYHRNRGTWFRLSKAGTPSGLATVDTTNGKISIPYGTETVEITAHEPDAAYPDGRAEFNVILNSQPTPDANGEYWQVLDFETSGFDMSRVLGLDEEYNQAKCVEDWGEDYAGTFTITPTEIRAADGTLLKTKAEHVVHSLLGTAVQNNHDKSVMGKNPNNGQDITYTRVSRDHLRLPRRLLVDNKGKTARIEDIQIVGNQLKFKLPKAFIEAPSTKYPIQHATGTDPAYTQDWDNWALTTPDGTWADYDLFTNKSVPKGAVAEIILANIQAGTENTTGIRTDGSSINRYLTLHEAEAGGETHCRMFVVCHATTGYIEVYGADISDAIFYLAGYWENVTFTEHMQSSFGHTTGWNNYTCDSGGASRVHHMVCFTATDGGSGQDVAITMGVRANDSSLERKILVHESEAGGTNVLDFMVKADASALVEVYLSSTNGGLASVRDYGYFGSELDFVEKWSKYELGASGWNLIDVSADLDQDGRMTDWLCGHKDITQTWQMGVKDGDDSSTSRYLTEHEAEDNGSSTGEVTGFGVSAKSNSSGNVRVYIEDKAGFALIDMFYLTGYFKPAANQAYKDISTRFKLQATAYKDTSTRFKIRVQGYKDTATRFALVTGGYKDTATRFKVIGQSYKDTSTRFKVNVLSFKDIAVRFKVAVQAFKDVAVRFKLNGRGYTDTATRFRVVVPTTAYKDTATRFKFTTFPQVAGFLHDKTSGTTHIVNLPSGIQVGDLLIVFFAHDWSPTVTFPAGWTQLDVGYVYNTTAGYEVRYRIADGTEGSSITVGTSTSELAAYQSFRIVNYSSVPVKASPYNTDISQYPNPPSLTTGWGTLDVLWLAMTVTDSDAYVTAYPSNYTNGTNDYWTDSLNGCGLATCRRELRAASEDPDTFTLDANEEWVAQTYAIRPYLPSAYIDARTRFKLVVGAYKDTPTRFKLNVQGYKDIPTRFKLWVTSFKDVGTRFKVWVQGYKDTATRFRLVSQAYKDVGTRLKLTVQAYRDVSTRSKLIAQNYKDTVTRFRTTVQSYKDASTRFRLNVQGYKDTVTRTKLIVQSYKDIATRFIVTIGTEAFKDVGTRFKLGVGAYKDTLTRVRVIAQGYKDTSTRFREVVLAYKDVPTRFILKVQGYKDTSTRFKITARSYQDVATRFRVETGAYKDISTRFRMNARSYLDVATRFKVGILGYKDASTRVKVIAQGFCDAATRFKLESAETFKDAPIRFKIQVQGYRDTSTRVKLWVQGFKDASTRFRVQVLSFIDTRTRFKLVEEGFVDASTRFKLEALGFLDAKTRFKVGVQAFEDTSTLFKLLAPDYIDTVTRLIVLPSIHAKTRFVLGQRPAKFQIDLASLGQSVVTLGSVGKVDLTLDSKAKVEIELSGGGT